MSIVTMGKCFLPGTGTTNRIYLIPGTNMSSIRQSLNDNDGEHQQQKQR
jgi:hypothetical protein